MENTALVKSHDFCLMCGEKNPISMKLRFMADDSGKVYADFKGHFGLQGYTSIMHGGVICSLLDAAMTHCLFAHGIEAVTGELKVKFHSSIPFDAPLKLVAEISKSMSPLYILTSTIFFGSKRMAEAEAKFMRKAMA
jgi:acyl-coenzyme A thioesterase PaaI-like protein